MKRIISILLIMALCLSSCNYEAKNLGDIKESQTKPIETTSKSEAQVVSEKKKDELEEAKEEAEEIAKETVENLDLEIEFSDDQKPSDFYSLNDDKLLQYVEDEIYASITENLGSEDYKVESVDAIYISKEYLEEVKYNSKENIYFGYTLKELDAQYDGQRYIFTVDDKGKTVTRMFEKYDDTYDEVIQNVALGTGLIFICVSVSVLTSGLGAPECISMVFATSAKSASVVAASSGLLSFVGSAIVKGIETGNVEETMKEASLAGSESFKWGAITGVITGGVGKTLSLLKSARTLPTPRQAELTVLERTKGAKEQISYLKGKVVPLFTKDASRPDVIIENLDGSVKAIEVKRYNLASSSSRSSMYKILKMQVESRVKNLPKGSTQEIVLDVRGRKFSKETTDIVIDTIKEICQPFYKDIPVRILAY